MDGGRESSTVNKGEPGFLEVISDWDLLIIQSTHEPLEELAEITIPRPQVLNTKLSH